MFCFECIIIMGLRVNRPTDKGGEIHERKKEVYAIWDFIGYEV